MTILKGHKMVPVDQPVRVTDRCAVQVVNGPMQVADRCTVKVVPAPVAGES